MGEGHVFGLGFAVVIGVLVSMGMYVPLPIAESSRCGTWIRLWCLAGRKFGLRTTFGSYLFTIKR
jgi:hypothetical protein